MQLPITGHCLCGKVHYKITGEPKMMGFCHCRSCQLATGAASFPFVVAATEDINFTGDVTWHTMSGSSGKNISRSFCTNCGSRMFGSLDVLPGLRTVSGSTLDNPELFQPQANIWTEDAQHWDIMDPELKKFAQNPTQE